MGAMTCRGIGPTYMLSVLMLVLFPLAVHASGKGIWQWIDAAQVQEMLREGSGLWMIDVRSSASYGREHVEGAVNVPSDELGHKKFPASKRLIVIDDSLGHRVAKEAADTLVKNGYGRVYVLDGGISAWRSGGYAVVGGKSPDYGITVGELKWALANNVPVRIFDMRDGSASGKGTLQGCISIEGKTFKEKAVKLAELVRTKDDSSTALASKLAKSQPIVLVFSAAEDAPQRIQELLFSVRADFRYIIGGYDAFVAREQAQVTAPKSCPTCPGGLR